MRRPLVVAVGHPELGDDGAGPAVARRLRELAGEAMRVVEVAGDAGEILAVLEGEDRVTVIDAVTSGAPPGTLLHLDGTRPLPAGLRAPASSHGLGLAEAVALARALGRLPTELMIVGIEGKSFTPGEGLSPAVERAVAETARWLAEALAPATAGG